MRDSFSATHTRRGYESCKAFFTPSHKAAISVGCREPMVEWMMERCRTAIFSPFATDAFFNPVWEKYGLRSSMDNHVALKSAGTFEKTPMTITSSPCTARTIAGRSFVARRWVNGNGTRITSPRWISPIRVKVFLGVPFGERGLGEFHHLKTFQPILEASQHRLQFDRRQLDEQGFDCIGWDIQFYSWHVIILLALGV